MLSSVTGPGRRRVQPALRRLICTTAAAVALAPLASQLPAASANPAGTGLVISEVYGAGGNAGASYNADFVELFNPTGTEITLKA